MHIFFLLLCFTEGEGPAMCRCLLCRKSLPCQTCRNLHCVEGYKDCGSTYHDPNCLVHLLDSSAQGAQAVSYGWLQAVLSRLGKRALG